MDADLNGTPPVSGGRPSAHDLHDARERTVPDVIGPGLRVLFCGINPSLWSAAVGHHFARPGNRFWKVLHESGLISDVLAPVEERRLLESGIGITNLVARATAAAVDLTDDELRAGAERLLEKLEQYEPVFVAIVGLGAFRKAFNKPRAQVGLQPDPLGPSMAWLLANPSGLQARYQLPELVCQFSALRDALPDP